MSLFHQKKLFLKRVLKISIIVLILFIFANISLNNALAQSLDLAQPISGLELSDADIIQEGEVLKVYWLAKYIQVLYSYGIYLVGVLALIMLMVGGLFWILAGGNPQRITTAKNIIGGAVTGLLLGLCSYLILYLI